MQNVTLQGYAGILDKCTVCHGVNPTGAGPHGLYVSAIEYDPIIKDYSELYDAYPNPFKDETNISFAINKKCKVSLEIFNNRGQRVRLLLDQHLEAGQYSVTFETSDIPSGIYYSTLRSDQMTFSKKLVIVK